MNRSELEGLITQTIQQPHHLPLSPKQQFQSQVRGLGGRPTHPRAQSEPDVSPHRLHHVSSLRVQHKQNVPAISSTQRTALSETSHNLQRSQAAVFIGNGVPDCSAEERKAWSKMSSKPTSTSTRHGRRRSSQSHQQAVEQHQLVLLPARECLESIQQPHKQARQSSLKQFKPLQSETPLDERPKTSRGLVSKSPERTSTPADAHEEAGIYYQACGDSRSRPGRQSKFVEGSMNARSVGVASSWYHDNTSGSESFNDSAASPAKESDTDSDATPRVTKPLPPKPALPPTTMKKSIFRFGSGRSSEESARTVEEAPEKLKERKGLRKSVSMWTFHALGDKIFGGSAGDAHSETTTDATTDKLERAQKDKKTGEVLNVDILNERKRKAEEAYAKQFGVKKQKSKLGQSASSAASRVHTNRNTTDDKRPKTPTLLRRKRERHTPGDQKRPAEALDGHTRPSRRDLERENQQLRSVLRQSQSMTFSRSASLHSIDLPPEGLENFVRGPVIMLSPGKKQGWMREDIPPVPKLPDQGTLAELQNRRGSYRLGMSTEKESQGFCERIEESEEGGEMGESEREPIMPGQWEWPDDVF